jgi:hypothetical protein
VPIGGLGGLIGLGGGEFRLPVLMYGIGFNARSRSRVDRKTGTLRREAFFAPGEAKIVTNEVYHIVPLDEVLGSFFPSMAACPPTSPRARRRRSRRSVDSFTSR